MNKIDIKSPLPLISVLTLIAFLNMTIGCSYYRVAKRAESDKASAQMIALAQPANNPDTKLPHFVSGTRVILQLKDGKLVKKYLIYYEGDFIYLGTRHDFQDQRIPIADVASVRKSDDKYFILHVGDKVWHLVNIVLNDGQTELKGEIEPLPNNHNSYLKTKPQSGSTNIYYPSSSDPTREVHLYSQGIKMEGYPNISIPLSAINKIEIYKGDAGATIASVFLTIVAVTVIAGVIIAATKHSCPFVYTIDGDTFSFAGEIYGGAIYSSLERNDYLPLPGLRPVKGGYQLKISNELLERQYTNVAELLVAKHPENTSVLLDKEGVAHAIGSPQSPSEVRSGKGYDYRSTVLDRDSSSYLFDDSNPGLEDVSDLLMTFNKPLGAIHARLILNAKNSYWLDYVYGKFNEQFGTSYNKFVEKQKKVSAAKLIDWSREQEIPLSVYVETERGWKAADYFNVIGPLASRDMVMDIDLSGVKGDTVRIKLESGFMFWEVDYAAMDFSENIFIEVVRVSASSAVDENGVDMSSKLAAADNQYLVQPSVGNEVVASFPAPERNGNQTVFLHSRGYYEYIKDYKNKPNWSTIYSFRKKSSFTKFAKTSYEFFKQSSELFPIEALAGNGN